MKHPHKQSRKTDPQEAVELQFEILKSNLVIYKHAVFASSEIEGKNKASLQILREIYKDDPKWLDLVKQVSDKVVEDRMQRGVGPKPVKTTYVPNDVAMPQSNQSPMQLGTVADAQQPRPSDEDLIIIDG